MDGGAGLRARDSKLRRYSRGLGADDGVARNDLAREAKPYSPPPDPAYGAPRPSQGAEPHESRQSGDGPADPAAPRSPEVQAGKDVCPHEGREGWPRDYKRWPGRVGGMLWRGESQGGFSDRSLTGLSSRWPPREQAPVGERTVLVPLWDEAPNAPTSRGDRPREGRLRARRTPRRAKPMDAPAPRCAGRFGRERRAGGDQTPHAARARDSESRATTGRPHRHVS